MRRLGMLALVALLSSSCATLGREYPRCDFPFVEIPVSILMEAQALPNARFGVCLNELEPGWTYHHMQYATGKVSFSLDSDRLGDGFLKVTMTESCDPGSAAGRQHTNENIKRFVEATKEAQPIEVVIVPMAESLIDYAAEVGLNLSGTFVRGRPLSLRLDTSGSPNENIQEAQSRGAFVLSVTEDDARRRTVQGRAPGEDRVHVDLTPADVIEGIEDRVEEGSYRATWFHLFEGGCVTYRFDAEGPGLEDLVAATERAVGFVDLAQLWTQAEQRGFILDESELDE